MKNKKAARYLLVGMVSFFSLLTICIIIRPIGLIVNSGISYYGNYATTFLPYLLMFTMNSAIMWKTALMISDNIKLGVYLKFVLRATAVLMIGILMTPYNGIDLFNLAHRTIGTILFSIQMIMAIMIIISTYRDRVNIMLIIAATVSGYAVLIYMLQPTGYMIEAQVVYQVSIWSLYIRYLMHSETKRHNI